MIFSLHGLAALKKQIVSVWTLAGLFGFYARYYNTGKTCGSLSAPEVYDAISALSDVVFFVMLAGFALLDQMLVYREEFAEWRVQYPGQKKTTSLDWGEFWTAVYWTWCNVQLGHAVVANVWIPLADWRGVCDPSNVPQWTSIYGVLSIACHLVALIVGVDLVFYSMHRTFHHKTLYPYIHKHHHRFRQTFAAAAIACHPLEHVMVNQASVLVPGLICGTPLPITKFWFALAALNSACSHSGYRLQSIPFGADPHDMHHQYFNAEFGAGGMMDAFFKTRLRDRYPRIAAKIG